MFIFLHLHVINASKGNDPITRQITQFININADSQCANTVKQAACMQCAGDQCKFIESEAKTNLVTYKTPIRCLGFVCYCDSLWMAHLQKVIIHNRDEEPQILTFVTASATLFYLIAVRVPWSQLAIPSAKSTRVAKLFAWTYSVLQRVAFTSSTTMTTSSASTRLYLVRSW